MGIFPSEYTIKENTDKSNKSAFFVLKIKTR